MTNESKDQDGSGNETNISFLKNMIGTPPAGPGDASTDMSVAETGESHLEKRFRHFQESSRRVLHPPFPKQIMVETTNICNHKCSFCAYTVMERVKGHVNKDFFKRIVQEAYDLGTREIGMFSGAEPFTCRSLTEYISLCDQIGYEYIYLSTNGVLAVGRKLEQAIDAGLSSIKFSLNAGTRDSYKKVHGKDDFDKAIAAINQAIDHKERLDRELFLGISFVECADNKDDFPVIKEMFEGRVDEICFYEANNQSGQLVDLPPPFFEDCNLPFNKIHVSVEGFLRACCNDYENMLAVADLNRMSLKDAWNSDVFVDLRQRHLDDRLENTLCGSCIRNCRSGVKPLDAGLLASPRQS